MTKTLTFSLTKALKEALPGGSLATSTNGSKGVSERRSRIKGNKRSSGAGYLEAA